MVWLALGLLAGLPLLAVFDSGRAASYWAVYVVERSLSLDNVFVFLLVFDYFAVPRPHRLRVARLAIVVALLFRAVAIALGAVLLDAFSIVSYLLGGVLLVLALRMLRQREEPLDPAQSPLFGVARRVLPLTPDSSSGRFVARTAAGRAVTPLGLALLALVAADLTFAVDSISASFGITRDFLAIWVANILALAGLVPLLVLVRALVAHFRYLSQTFATVLLFIAARLLLDDIVEIRPNASLVGIGAILLVGIVVSIVADRIAKPPKDERAERRPPRCPPAARRGLV